jgi:hypothetical protein
MANEAATAIATDEIAPDMRGLARLGRGHIDDVDLDMVDCGASFKMRIPRQSG